jgi:general stress protein 26
MKIEEQKSSELKRLAEAIDAEPIAMMTTVDKAGRRLHSRPLAALKMDAEPALWFLVSISSGKIAELDEFRETCLSFSGKGTYLCVSGTATLVRDRSVIAALWTPVAKAWFPAGVDDPDLAALKVSVEQAELWDGPHNPVTRLFALAVAATTGNTRFLGEEVKLAG